MEDEYEEDYLSIYDEDNIVMMLEDDEITILEAEFMRGYIAA